MKDLVIEIIRGIDFEKYDTLQDLLLDSFRGKTYPKIILYIILELQEYKCIEPNWDLDEGRLSDIEDFWELNLEGVAKDIAELIELEDEQRKRIDEEY